MSKEKQIDIIAKIIARKAADYRNPNVAFMTIAKKSATAIYHEFCDKQSEGEWVDFGKTFYCSVCKKTDWNKSSYCPNCGAKMKGGADDE